MKKRIALLLSMIMVGVTIFTGCSKPNETVTKDSNQVTLEPNKEVTPEATLEPTVEATPVVEKLDINIAALKGPTAIGLVHVINESEQGNTTNNYNLTVAGAADEITAGIIKGDYPIATVPCNLASVLYAKSEGKIKVAGINTLGVLYIVETGDTIQSIEDLRGKTIYSTGKGTTPEFTLNYLLTANGIDPQKDVTIEYNTEATEVAAMLSKTENAIAMLPQPYVTTVMMNNDKVRIALDITKEWEAISDDSTVVTGVVVVNAKFLEEHEDAVKAFLDEYQRSVAYVNEEITESAALIEKYGIIKQAVAVKALPYCNIVLLRNDEMKQKVEAYLKVLYDQNPAAVGKTMPDDAFYYVN